MRMPLKTKAYYAVGRYLPFLKIAPPQLERRAALTLRPARNSLLKWETRETGETILTVPQNPKANRLTKRFARLLQVPTSRNIELDEVGGFVWELCDGSHTVETIVQQTGREYKMNRREAEVSVTMFLQMLHERNFIGFYKKTGSKKTEKPALSGRKNEEKSGT